MIWTPHWQNLLVLCVCNAIVNIAGQKRAGSAMTIKHKTANYSQFYSWFFFLPSSSSHTVVQQKCFSPEQKKVTTITFVLGKNQKFWIWLLWGGITAVSQNNASVVWKYFNLATIQCLDTWRLEWKSARLKCRATFALKIFSFTVYSLIARC